MLKKPSHLKQGYSDLGQRLESYGSRPDSAPGKFLYSLWGKSGFTFLKG